MKVSDAGLSGWQWAEAIVIALSIFPVDALLKCIPDEWAPKMGQDTNDDRRLAAKKAKIGVNQ
jgi:hypothetical protein